jgi:hypothetical protein
VLENFRVRFGSISAEQMPWWEFGMRCIWVVLQLAAAYCLANEVSPFFYQRF